MQHRHRAGIVLGSLFALLMVVTLTSCGSTTYAASGSRAPLPTATPVPTATPTPSPTPRPAPTSAPTPEPAAAVETAEAGRGSRQLVVVPESAPAAVVPVLDADDPDARPWPTEFTGFVNFVEATGGLPFRSEAPTIISVDEAAMVARLTGSIPSLASLDPDVAEAVRRVDDTHRALGIATDSFDILTVNTGTAGAIQGVFTETTHEILIRSDAATPLEDQDIGLQVTVVHEIAHAWQGRDRIRRLGALATDQLVAGAIIEGEADWIAQSWLAQRPDADRTVHQAGLVDGPQAEGDQPASLIAEVQMQYQLGRRLYAVARAAGIDVVTLDDMPPVNAGSLLDPWVWADGTAVDHRVLPPPTAQQVETLPDIRPPANAVLWLQVFASAMPIEAALDAARHVTSTSPLAVWVDADDQTCVASEFTVTTAGRELVISALDQWVARLAEHRSFTNTTSRVALVACDPGPQAVPTPVVAADRAIAIASAAIDVESVRRLNGANDMSTACVAAVAGHVEAHSALGLAAPPDWAALPQIAALSECG